MEPLISIITLTYNHEKFISQCIESCLNQSYKNWEQIIIDDGSADKTQEIIMKYRDPRIKYFHQSHKGPNSILESYNKALKISKGEYISILEGDDFSPPDKLQILLEPFKKKKEIVLSYGLTQEITEEGRFTHKIIPPRFKYIPFSILFNNPVGKAALGMADPKILTFTFPCSVLIKRKYLEKIGRFKAIEGCPLVDYPTFLHLTLKGTFYFIPKIVGYWRRRKGNITQIYFEIIKRKIHDYSLEFLKKNSSILNIEERDLIVLERKWRKVWSYIWFQQGRMFLVDRKWNKARKKFLKTISHPASLFNFFGGFLGLLFSLFHLDLEGVAKLLGRVHYQN